ncbi:hypothetical protein [Nostoc sp. JL23]|uniref:hypothetical protein n=1 Tax=Nostoc sp. JL23 TaxID=2815394 RepID=UPI0025EFBF76|nr:hypothetical protein [Nostoc sp. JL23]
MTNQEKPDLDEKTSKNQVNPLVSGFVIVVAIFIIFTLLNSAINTPLVRSFDDAARRAEIDACESHRANASNKSPGDDCSKLGDDR